MPDIAILILAAGTSSRMGRLDKLAQDADGAPLLTRVSERAAATGLPVHVTLPDLAHPRAALIRGLGAHPVPVPDRDSGMSASIRAGIAALPPDTPGAMILPADMPDLRTEDLQSIARAARAAPQAIIRASTPEGIAGHPVIFPADLFDELRGLSGDQGARRVIAAHRDRLQPHVLAGTRAIVDLDTPADWAAWRAARQTQKGRPG